MSKPENSTKEILEDIRDNTALPWWRSLVNGMLTGAGWVLGTVLAIAVLGWVLSFFGVIPGFGELAAQLQYILNSKI